MVEKDYFKSLLEKKTKQDAIPYGKGTVVGKTAPGARVSAIIGGKTNKATANDDGKYTLKNVPPVKIGGKIKLKYELQGANITKSVKVKKEKSEVYTPYYTYKSTKNVKVKASNIHPGDYIKMKIGTKTYYYRGFKKNASSKTVKIKIKKPQKYGIKMKTQLLNKYNQVLATESEYVYLSDTVHKGDSKKKVKWLTYWNNPDQKYYYSYGETWAYDWNDDDGIHDAWLFFNTKGKVTGWEIID